MYLSIFVRVAKNLALYPRFMLSIQHVSVLLCTISEKSTSRIFIRDALSIMSAIFDWCLPQGAKMADDAHRSKISKFIPANFFWDISVRFLSWEFWDFCRRHDHFRRFPKKSEVFRRRPKSAEGEVIEKTLIHKIRDREEGIVIYSFTHGFRSLHGSELTYFWKLCQARRQQLTFFNQAWEIGPQAWAGVRSKFSTRRRETHA